MIVEFNGERTEGLGPHIELAKRILRDNPATEITEHLIKFGDGEWTCAVSRILNMGRPELKLVTVARWRGDQISEEYIFGG